jgi:molybdopterin-guanine dinucleotide biosynthesis protein A
MQCAGFVLAGGHSSRMGSDKALLPFKGGTLVEHVAEQVHQAAGNVTLVGNPERYSNLSYRVIRDIYPARSPLSGIHAAVAASFQEWNLIVACDMPEVTAAFLAKLIERAECTKAQAVIPTGPSGMPEPLCAAYSRASLGVIADSLERDIRKVMDGLTALEIDFWPVSDSRHFQNLNTPEEWTGYCHG